MNSENSLRTASVVLGVGLLFFSTAAAWAQQKYSIVTSVGAGETSYPQQHFLDVGDMPDHQVRIYEIHRVHTSNPIAFRGVKVTDTWSRGTSDYVDYSGQTAGYSVYHLENGDRIFARYAGTVQSTNRSDGTREYVYHGITTLTGGTGDFRNIRGYIRDVTKGASKGGKALSNEITGEGEYWFQD